MKLPLHNRLKRQLHCDIAHLQDVVVETVYSLEENAVLHGGTSIWRCFNGNRFSEDLDFYFKPKLEFKELLAKKLLVPGLKIPKFRQTGNAIYSKIENESIGVALEVSLREFKKPVVCEYEKADGTSIDVFTPSADELLVEKLLAFKSRRLIRDIYDVYHLSRFSSQDKAFLQNVRNLLEKIPKPADEQNLKNLVLTGAVPSFEQMVLVLNQRFLK